MRAAAPIWLSRPTRVAALARRPARWGLGLLAAFFLLAAIGSGFSVNPPSDQAAPTADTGAAAAEDRSDLILYSDVVAGVAHGDNYYLVATRALRQGGYPVKPFIAVRLPTLAVVSGALPPAILLASFWIIAMLALLAWWDRFGEAFVRPVPRLLATLLVGCGGALIVAPELVLFHEAWAALLITLGLARWRPGRWVESVALLLAATLIRETAVLAPVIMGALALAERRRSEALAWAGAIAVLAVVLVVHAQAVAAFTQPFDPASEGWGDLGGFGFFAKAVSASSALGLAPAPFAAALVVLALAGWAAWDDPLALRVLAILVAYALVIATLARTDTYYWAFLIAPLLPAGLAMAPDAVASLWSRAIDRRRITIHMGTR